VVGAVQTSDFVTESAIEKSVAKELARGGKSGVEIDCAEDSFVGVGEEAFLTAASGFLFAGTETQIIAQMKALSSGVQRNGVNQAGESLGKFARIPIGKCVAEDFTCDEAKNAVAEKFEALIVQGSVVLAARAMGKSLLEAFRMGKAMTENRSKFFELFSGHRWPRRIT
jgi:hypothetical protein